MLINLHVKNLALIEEADVDFTKHLNILTGETGAGKSILIGSIQAALGAKIPKSMIRTGQESALIELIFETSNPEIEKKMEEYEIPFEDGELIISRRITNSRVINKINDSTITLNRLRELAPMLLDLSGQHDNQLLLHPENHLKILDHYGQEPIAGALQKTAAAYETRQRCQKELEENRIDEDRKIREMEFLRYEIQEIDEAALVPGEDEELELLYRKISHARDILEDCGSIYEMLSEDPMSASTLIGKSLSRMMSVSNLDESAQTLTDQLADLEALILDYCRDLHAYMHEMEFDEETFFETEERLNLINHLKSKYGDSIEKILAGRQERAKRLHDLENLEAYVTGLEAAYDKAQKELEEAAKALSLLRKDVITPLCEKIRQALASLNFHQVVFDIQLEKTEHYSAKGNDRACFMVSLNPGNPPAPLHEIASGGELSRIMLAIKSVLADAEQIDTLIFDEIDAGISGRTAQKVSERLRLIAADRQVIAITHLPQIAAMADSHFLIEKTSDETSTISSIRQLTEEESVLELARMLGGVKITDAVLDNAREMKALAEGIRCNIQ